MTFSEPRTKAEEERMIEKIMRDLDVSTSTAYTILPILTGRLPRGDLMTVEQRENLDELDRNDDAGRAT